MPFGLLVGLFLIGCVSSVLHGYRVFSATRGDEGNAAPSYMSTDSRTYINCSEALFDDRPVPPLFRERAFYHTLLALSKKITGDYVATMWVSVFLEIPAVMAIGY